MPETAPETLPDEARGWLDGTAFPVMATVDPDGRPQLSIVWAKRDGDVVVFSTLADRRKGRNLARDPSLSVLIPDPDDPYRYVEVRGRAEVTPDPGGALIEELSRKYTGHGFTEAAEKSAGRVIVRVQPEHVVSYLDD